MSSLITTLVILGVVGYVLMHRCDLLNIGCGNGSSPSTSSGGGNDGGSNVPSPVGGGATAAAGKMIYRGTGKVLTGDLAVLDANKAQSLDSGGSRPSTRFIWGSGKGKGAAKCVDFNSYEATVYAKLGPGGSANTRAIVTGGGGGQRGKNCCVYSVGFVTSSGEAFAEEEGAHEPHPTIEKMPVVGGSIKNIGPLKNRTIGFKEVLIRGGGQVLLEGWVDPDASGNWKLFYRARNPKGGNLPVITKTGLVGETCGEVRFRCDDIWPVTIDTSRSFVAELPDNAVPAGGNVGNPVDVATGGAAPKGDVQKKAAANIKKTAAKYARWNTFNRIAI